jgi:filamentous hemagglutinin family protein
MLNRFVFLLILGFAHPAPAQLIPDRSLGSESSVAASDRDGTVISGGALRGGNLFHSFQELNIGDGQQVYFANPAGIDRILARVTGANPSQILGTLGVLGHADLYLLNPNGIVFGPNARLDLRGSFLATTGDRIQFSNYEFSAATPTAPPLLTLSAPIGLQVGANPGSIQVQAGLTVPQGLGLVGGDITFTDSTVTAEQGIRLTGRTITMEQSQLRSTTVDADGGAIEIQAQRLNLLRNSMIEAVTEGSGSGGDIQINTGNLHLRDGGAIIALTGAIGPSGDVRIQARQSIRATGTPTGSQRGNYMGTVTLSAGAGGDVEVQTRRLVLANGNRIQTESWDSGAGGDVTVQAEDITVRGVNERLPVLWSGILTTTAGTGAGGDIQVTADRLRIEESGYVISTTLVSNRDFYQSLLHPDRTFSAEPGRGDAGDVRVSANAIVVAGTSSLTPSKPSVLGSITLDFGDAGDVTVAADQIRVASGGTLLSSNIASSLVLGTPINSFERGDSGDLRINADQIIVEGVNPFVEIGSLLGTLSASDGAGGHTTLNTGSLWVRDGGAVTSGTYAGGNAGQLTIRATDWIRVEGVNANSFPSSIGTFAYLLDDTTRQAFFLPPRPEGDTGALRIWTPSLTVLNGGKVTVQNQGLGDAGRMTIEADRLHLDGGEISAETAAGQGGNIRLRVGDRLQLSDSQITATVRGSRGGGGNLAIDGGLILANPGDPSDITANANRGRGGNIRIRSQGMVGLSSGDITASSRLGVDGNVVVNAPVIESEQGLGSLSATLVDGSRLMAAGCPADEGAYFAIAGRGGLPSDPRQPLAGQVTLQDLRTSPAMTAASRLENRASSADRSSADRSAAPAIEAQGWRTLASGQIELIARSSSPGNWLNPSSCSAARAEP